jgi:nucleotide-binding universal stress UspA family protein
MPAVQDRLPPPELDLGRSPTRPVVLGTLASRFDPSAERMALESALERGAKLLVVNAVRLQLYPRTLALVAPSGATLPHEEDFDAVRATARRTAAAGLRVEHLRVKSSKPVDALVDVAHQRDAGLLVFGPDLARVGAWRFRRAAGRVRRRARCLVWIAPDG